MKKIKDRMTLGIISGFIGNIAKEIVGIGMIKIGFGNINGSGIASSIFLPEYKVKYMPNKKTKAIGFIGDMIIGSSLGIAAVYMLSATGKDNHLLKGAGTGHFLWTSLYGFLAGAGASSVHPLNENNNLNALINHTVYGLVTSAVAVKLGDESLFKPSQAQNNLLSKPGID